MDLDRIKKEQNKSKFLKRKFTVSPPNETEDLKKSLSKTKNHIHGTSLFVDVSPDDPIKAPSQPDLHKERT